ncbi:MAG: hypothetical protein R2856_03060 [Caldilineaceae bacterium]
MSRHSQMLRMMGGAAGVAALAACARIAAPTTSTGGEGGDAPAQAATAMTVVGRREYFKEMEKISLKYLMNEWAAETTSRWMSPTVAAEANEDFVAKTWRRSKPVIRRT